MISTAMQAGRRRGAHLIGLAASMLVLGGCEKILSKPGPLVVLEPKLGSGTTGASIDCKVVPCWSIHYAGTGGGSTMQPDASIFKQLNQNNSACWLRGDLLGPIVSVVVEDGAGNKSALTDLWFHSATKPSFVAHLRVLDDGGPRLHWSAQRDDYHVCEWSAFSARPNLGSGPRLELAGELVQFVGQIKAYDGDREIDLGGKKVKFVLLSK
jgi:hypothetical protein